MPCRRLIKKNGAIAPALLDIGAGSGILCLVADCFGISRAVGVEKDPVCGPNMAENLRKNRPKSPVGFTVGDVRCLKSNPRFDIVVMNMISSEGMPLFDAVRVLLKDGGRFVWSGLLLEERKNILATARSRGFDPERNYHENEWWCASFVKTPAGENLHGNGGGR